MNEYLSLTEIEKFINMMPGITVINGESDTFQLQPVLVSLMHHILRMDEEISVLKKELKK